MAKTVYIMKGKLTDMKNSFKKILSIILALVITLSLTACGETKNEIKVGGYVISADEFAYQYCLIWENYRQSSYQYDLSFGEGTGLKQSGYDYSLLPSEQKYDDKYSGVTDVTIEDLGVENPTWEDVFVYITLSILLRTEYVLDEAKKNNFVLEDTETENIDNNVDAIKVAAAEVNLSFEDYMKERYGARLTEEEYRKIFEKSNLYNVATSKFEEKYMSLVTAEEIQKEYESDKETYDKYGDTIIGDVRHILIQFPLDEKTGKQLKISDKEKEDYLKKAQDVLDLYKKNPTEENYLKLVTEYSDDTASVSVGGLYTYVKKDGKYVAPFESWAVDSSRQVGDVEIVETIYGYHIMYFVKSYGNAKDYTTTRVAAGDKFYDDINAIVREKVSKTNVRSKQISKITDEQDNLIRVLMRTLYKVEEK